MKRVMSLVDLQREEVYIKELTQDRPIASLPFAGRYRLVDFALSSMVTSGISFLLSFRAAPIPEGFPRKFSFSPSPGEFLSLSFILIRNGFIE